MSTMSNSPETVARKILEMRIMEQCHRHAKDVLPRPFVISSPVVDIAVHRREREQQQEQEDKKLDACVEVKPTSVNAARFKSLPAIPSD